MIDATAQVHNQFHRGGEGELRCMSCNRWMTSRDLRCGNAQDCEECCNEPARLHDDPFDPSIDNSALDPSPDV